LIAIETKNLSRKFGKFIAVDNLNLSIPEGVLYGLIGPNGAGKTTTLRMLSGLLEPTGGDIFIGGEPTSKGWQELKKQIGYMPDFFGVYEDLLVWEYLDFYARCYGIPSVKRQYMVDELLDLVDLQEKRNAYVETLSRGMRQRLCLAHALVHDPKILLLDEPASGLDPRARVEMRALLRELGKMGKTIVLSSHILTELAELCDYVGIVEKGQMVTSGTISQIRQQIFSGRVFQIKIISDIEKAVETINSFPEAGEVRKLNGYLELRFDGDDEALANFVEKLVSKNVRFTALQEQATNLEDLFLQLTKGEII